MPGDGSPIPFTIIAGFLGSGKTTLLNHVLSVSSGVRYAVMVNDFGELEIDAALVRQHDGDTVSFANGCVCCTLGDDLFASIDALLARNPPPEQFLVEISGVADPKSLADVATLHPRLSRDLIITLIDASAISTQLDDARLVDTVHRHLRHADLVVLNKCDLVDEHAVSTVRARVRSLRTAPVFETTNAALPTALLSGNPEATASLPAVSLTSVEHTHSQTFHTASVQPSAALSLAEICAVLADNRVDLVRAKGFVHDSETGFDWLIQYSGSRVHRQRWQSPESSAAPNGLVLIGLCPLQPLLERLTVAG